jgi:uncharacterized alpha-E superfamily protein/hemerythrin-like domain-containing protein
MLLSSVAEAMFWTGRYFERAQALARVVLGYERLSFDLPAPRKLELGPLFALMDRAPDPVASHDRAAALHQLVLDDANPSSVLGALLAARENLRVARVVAPVELWTTASALVHHVKEHAQGPEGSLLEALEATLALGSRFEGERQASMTHDSAYAFLEMGCNIERADMLVRALGVLTPVLLPQGWERAYDDVRWTGLLHALGLHSTYRRLHHHQAELPRLLGLALSDTSCPRAVAHCLLVIRQQLAHVPRGGQVGERLGAALDAALAAGRMAEDSLLQGLSPLTEQLASLNASIGDCYFPRLEAQQLPSPSVARSRSGDPFEHLGREHAQMDAVLQVLEALSLAAEGGQRIDRAELQAIVAFLADCGEWGHHEKEESILTPVLASHGFDWYEGPLANMRREHRQEHYFIRVLTHLATQTDDWSKDDARSFVAVAREFCHFLHAHMGHEQHDLFEQASRTLPANVQQALCRAFEELDARQRPSAAQSRAALSALVEKYVPAKALRFAS